MPSIIQDLFAKEESELMYKKIIDIVKENKIDIWSSNYNNETTILENGEDFLTASRNNEYLITLNAYSDKKGGALNHNIKELCNDIIKIPAYLQNNRNVDYNLWISSNYHDTGLHFDDNDGLLFVAKGKKDIILYPPNDIEYLAPFDLTPNYALQRPVFMKYNANVLVKDYVAGFSAEMLLYKTLQYFASSNRINQAIQNIYNKKMPDSKLIYGFKKENDTYRWEIYYYHYHYKNKRKIDHMNSNSIYVNTDILHTSPISELQNNNKIIINSVDILNHNNRIYNNIVHTYEAKEKTNGDVQSIDELPFYGLGFDITVQNAKHGHLDMGGLGKKEKVGEFIYSSKEDIMNNVNKYFDELNLPYNDNVHKILLKYDCEDMCIWNKKGTLFIQWLVISIDDFIHFLQEFQYDVQMDVGDTRIEGDKSVFVNYVIENRENYRNISHEITIVYDKNTLLPIRTGFYGCL